MNGKKIISLTERKWFIQQSTSLIGEWGINLTKIEFIKNNKHISSVNSCMIYHKYTLNVTNYNKNTTSFF